MKRQKYKAAEKMLGPICTHMREVAFGAKAKVEVYQIMERSARMRDDDALLRKAQEKRDRKRAQRIGS